MRSLISPRRQKFYRLIREADQQTTDWLVAAVTDPTRNNGNMSSLARLACLRVLVCRDRSSGWPYPERKHAMRFEIGIPNPRWRPADGYTKDLFPGAILMTAFFSRIHATCDMTVAINSDGQYVPIHGSVRMEPVATVAEAKSVLFEYWQGLKPSEKMRAFPLVA